MYQAKEAELAARRQKLQQSEEALRRRVAELDEVWSRLQSQIEQREQPADAGVPEARKGKEAVAAAE